MNYLKYLVEEIHTKTMTQAEKREYLITELLKGLPEYESIIIPTD